MASQSELLEAKQRVDYLELPARSYITRCSSTRMPFQWTINPYRGCEIGCKYCYARYTHEFMELDPAVEFESRIFAKRWDSTEFRRELRKVPAGDIIALGTATDPYQPAEKRFEVTRRMLEVVAGERGLRLGITTKSDLVARDVELLARISQHNYLQVNISIITTDVELARSVEPKAPRPELRFLAMRRLTDAGVSAGVLIAPVLPQINDSLESMEAVAKAAVEAGATALDGGLLFLQPTARSVFLPWLEVRYPGLAARYADRFSDSAFLSGAYPAAIRERLNRVRNQYGLNSRFFELPKVPQPQLNLLTL